jgi:PKD repeat protein
MLKKTTAFILLFAAMVLAADDYSQWIYYRNIVINTLAAGVANGVGKFPLLVRLTAADSLIFKTAKDSGQDVRFSKSTGTHFPYQIERWDKPNMAAEIWVLVDAIIGNNGTQFIKMYWGNSSAADSSKPTAVFNTSNGYMAVYHVAGNLNDATANAYTGADTGTINADTAALIGYGRRFDGLHFFSPGDLPDRPRGTISCWFRPGFDFNSSRTYCNGIWGKKTSDTNDATLTLRGSVFNNAEGNAGSILTKMENKTSPTTGASIYLTTNTNSFSTGVWYHVAWTWGNNADSIYLNGTRENSKENVTDGSIGVTGTGNDEIGRSKYDSTGNVPHNPNTSFNPSYFLGSMDEIRLDTVVRSSAWVKLCYQNQRLTNSVDSLTKLDSIHPQPPTGLSYAKTKAYYPVGTAITANTASAAPTGVIIDSFTVTPQLPLSLSLDKFTGLISGTPNSGSGTAAIYTITARNVSGSVTCKDTFTIFVLPSIAAQPANVTAKVGDKAIFSLTAGGSSPLTYQWWRGASVVSGAIAAQCTVSSVTTADDNAIFKCVVRYSPTGDSAWSNPCTLHVSPPPSITTQPTSITVLHGSSASFSIAATGTPTPTYIWIKNSADTMSAATTNTLTIPSPQKADDLSRFRCVVKNSGGSVTSNLCTLRVVSAGFSARPTVGIDTLTVNFVDSSTGGAAVYKWKFGDGDSLATASPSHFYSGVGKYSVTQIISVAGIVDSLRIPDCITINYSKPVVLFFADTFYAVDSLTVHFSDSSKGKITSRKWDFGDSSTSASDTTKVTHTYKAPGSYTVKLLLTGPGGVDSFVRPDYIKVRSKSDYQVFIKASKLSPDSIIISIYNFTTIITSKNTPFPPYADTLGLWFKRGAIPTKSSDSLLFKYSVIDMQTKGQIPFIDTVRVPRSPLADSVFYGFNTSAFWTPDPMTTFKASDGDLVFMRDTVRPINKLRISGAYLGVDSFAIYCDSILSLDSFAIDSIGIWYGFKDSINFSDAGHAKWLSLPAAIAGAAQGLYTIKSQASLLNGDTVRIYCAVQVVAKNRLRSVIRSASFTAGRPHPNNPIRLIAKATSPTVIQLTWKEKNTGKIVNGVDSIVIWRGMRLVPLVFDTLPPEFIALRPSVGDTSLISDGLNEKTRYYYGARIYSGGLWSFITESSSATDSTPEIQTVDRPKNTVKMTKLNFDMALNQIIAGWEIDSFDTNQEIGITYSTVSFAADTLHLPTQVVKVTKPADSKMVAIPKLVFDSTYFVSLWLRKKDSKWAYPTFESQRSLKMPSDVSWQVVRYFDKFPDTVITFNGKLLLANDIGDTIPTTDTVKYQEVPEALARGFVPVSNGFYFALHLASAPFHIGILYSQDSIPAHYSAADIRIYYEKGGEIYVLKNTIVDTTKHMAWALINDVSYPLIALIDTIPLTVEVLSHTGDPVISGRAIVDTFLIRDNCANSGYYYSYGKGDNSRAVSDPGEVQRTETPVIKTIDASFVNQENGVRALFTASDGPHTITKNVSRQVIRDSTSDIVSVPAGKWFPLQTTAQLDSPGVKHALKDLYVQGKWYYNNAVFRLFRWCAYSGNARDSVKWVEYSDTTEWIFNFDPCRLLWIKTKNDVTLHIGKGITTSLKKGYTILAAAHTWTDVALPYGFDIRIGDVIDSTNAANGGKHKGDSLYYYFWQTDQAKQYRSQLLYLSQFEKTGQLVSNKTDSLSKNVGGFTIFNPLDTPVTLSIPPIPASMSSFRPAKKTGKKSQQSSGWAVRIAGKTESGMSLSDVYCGYCEGKPEMHFYPAPAFFSDIGVRVCDSLKREYGHALAQGRWNKESGAVFPLAFSNSSEKPERINYTVENLQDLPKNVKAFIVDYSTGKCENASQPSVVTLSKGQTSYRHLAIGTDEFLKKVQRDMQLFHLSLVAAFPNPFSHALKIRYTLPFAGVSIVRFTIIDLMGRVVWERQIPCAASMGMQEYIWGGVSTGRRPVVGGIYILRMTALDEGNNSVGSFKRKISYLP